MLWNEITSIATVISMVAFIVTALYIRAELKALERDRYVAVTNQFFAIWETREFTDAQLWLLHRLEETTWQDFIKRHRADMGEAAFHRVGSFYNRIGTLVRLGLINQNEILTTMGGYAIAVWQKIQPLVYEARRIEHSTLFTDFEGLLPACYECYVPTLGPKVQANPFSLPPSAGSPNLSPPRISPVELKARLDKGDPLIILDVRHPPQLAGDSRALPQAVLMAPEQMTERFADLPISQELVVYCA